MGAAAKRREKRKAAKAQAAAPEPAPAPKSPASRSRAAKTKASPKKKTAKAAKPPPADAEDDDVIIEYVAAPLELDGSFAELGAVVEKFNKREDGYAATYVKPEDLPNRGTDGLDGVKAEDGVAERDAVKTEDDSQHEDEDDEDDDTYETDGGVSNKARKVANRMRVAELKQLCARPEVVEAWDVAAADPRLLVYLKSYRNTVPVPQHWCQKRAFLAGKRGLEKPPWQLPSFIEATGIQKLRDAYAEKEEGKKLKQKGKDATTAKMGKIDIDYQVLHDAFFKFQTKPKMTAVGEVYYEGKEYETPVEGKRPGWLSEETREALGVAEDGPPPWLINMQRYGPPPSYPHLKIPGVSAPIPAGAQFGYHPGGWGKPPVDALGRPIYGDVFGVGGERPDESTPYDLVLRKDEPWGALEDADESEDESEGESDEEGSLAEGSEPDAAEEAAGAEPEALEPLDLRKEKRGKGEEDEGPPQLYRVLDVEDASVAEGSLMGSAHTYVVPGAGGAVGAAPGAALRRARREPAAGATEIALDPEDLERGMDDAAVAARFEAETAARRAAAAPEDFSDMVAENARKSKRKADAKKKESDAKKFKF